MRAYEIRDYNRFSGPQQDTDSRSFEPEEGGGFTRLVQRFIIVVMLTVCLIIMAACVHLLNKELKPYLQQTICSAPSRQA